MPSENTAAAKIGTPSSPYLVYTSAGSRSNIKKWVSGKRNFDLWVTQYDGESAYHREISDFYNERKGGKYPNFHNVYQHWGDLLGSYRAVFLLDDDIEISGTQISQLFRIQERYNLVLLQPGFLTIGKISHTVTISEDFSFARHVNFVENCVALFSKSFLDRFMQVYDPRLIGFGTDWWYLHLLTNDERSKVAIIDSIPCINPDERLERRVRQIDVLQPTSTRVQIWEDIRHKHGIENPPGGVRTLDRFWPSELEDWLTLLSAPLIRIKVFFFYPHYYMRLKRLYWRLSWRLHS